MHLPPAGAPLGSQAQSRPMVPTNWDDAAQRRSLLLHVPQTSQIDSRSSWESLACSRSPTNPVDARRG